MSNTPKIDDDDFEPFNGLVINGYGIYNKRDQQALYQLILEVIGEDEKTVTDIKTWVLAQNDLRQEQRQKLTKLFKEDK